MNQHALTRLSDRAVQHSRGDESSGLTLASPAGRYPATLVLLFTMLCAACTPTLQRAELPAETALPTSQASFWEDIDSARAGDWFHLLNTGDEALAWRLRVIDSARESLDLETFLWKPDNSGQQIMAHILAAAERGVRVRFLLDDSFTMHEGLALHTLDEHPNISLRLYNPFQHRSDGVVWRELFNAGEFARTNHRMHNKVLVADGRVALVGGRNLADEYFGRHADFNFRDMEVITMGASLPRVVEHFDAFWNSGWAFPISQVIAEPKQAPSLDEFRDAMLSQFTPLDGTDPDTTRAAWIAVAKEALAGRAEFFFDQPASNDPAEPDELPDQLAGELQRVIDSAAAEVILVSAYLVPTPELEAVVERVEARGVHVRILTNSLQSNNHLTAHAAYRHHVEQLVEHGADLHEVRPGATDRHLYMQTPVGDKQLGLHAKLLLVDDDIAFIGSCNLDPRSLKINTEVGLLIESEEVNAALREDLAIDFKTRNAWAVRRDENGSLVWVGDDQVLHRQPAASSIQRLEAWFLGLLPIDSQM